MRILLAAVLASREREPRSRTCLGEIDFRLLFRPLDEAAELSLRYAWRGKAAGPKSSQYTSP